MLCSLPNHMGFSSLVIECVFILYWSFKNTTWPTRMFQDDGFTSVVFVAWMLYTHWQDNAGYSNSSPLSIYSLHIFTFHAYLLPLPLCFSSWMQLSLYRLSSMSLACLALFIMAQQGVLMIPCRLATSVSPSLLLTQVPGHGRYSSNFFNTPQDVMLHLWL